MSSVRAYKSPVREKQLQETREAILTALHDLMADAEAPDDIPVEAIAERAGIQRRTVFRHFPTKADLLAAFWPWLNARIGTSPAPDTLREVVEGPRRAFPRFDANEGAIRAALHSRTGREMRLGTVADRRRHFAAALAWTTRSLPPAEAARIEALAHLLYSASAWEALKDYGGLTGAEAGEAASWALEVILSAVTPGLDIADTASQPQETRDDD